MMWRHAEPIESGNVGGRRIARIRGPPVPWVSPIELSHQSIAKHLGHDGGTRDGLDARIALDHRLVRADQIVQLARWCTIHERKLYGSSVAPLESAHGALHRKM